MKIPPSLYTSAIRYALTRRLATVMSVNTLVAGFKMAGPDWLMSFSQPLVLIGTGLCYLAVTYQVAGYDSHSSWPSKPLLLTDYMCVLCIGMQLFCFPKPSSSNRTWLVSNSISQAQTFKHCLQQTRLRLPQVCKNSTWKKSAFHDVIYSTDVFSRVLPVAESSGDTAVSARYSLPSVLNFNHFTYFNSTRTCRIHFKKNWSGPYII